MDDSGNILIKRIAKANVYVKSGDGENAVANEILKVGSIIALQCSRFMAMATDIMKALPDKFFFIQRSLIKMSQVPGGALELDKPVKLFDMKKFQQNVAR